MAKTTVSELQVLISANAAAFQAQLDAVKKQMASMGAVSNKTGSKVGAGLKSTALRYIGLGAAITGAFKAMKAASSYIEDENLFAVSMRNAADETRAWSDQVERSVGVSGAWLRKYTGIMTNMSASMGLSHKEASKLGKNVALLSQDLASFYNISPEAAFEKMQSAMAGMPRPLQDLGIMVRDQELQQTALALGIRKTNGEFTAAQKALLTYETVIRATKNAQGDLSRTLNTPANQMRMLATNARNLGVAIGTMFQPLLSVALPVLNAIVMAATSAMRALAGLFGIEFKAEASAIGNVEAGVGGIGEAADKAGGKIKKLKGQLASFDEMNTIQEQDSGGGSGGGGGGAGSLPQIDWGKYNAGLDGVKNKAVAIAEAIKKAFKDFGKGFNFDKIGNAFKRFFNDANKFLKPIGKILGDLWGYFKPFIYWTANDLLPAFLNALGGAINFVGAVIGRVWDSFLKPFVDVFLTPIASFTGGVIVWVLNAIGDGLRWIAENELAVSVVTGLVAAFTTYHGILLAVNTASALYQTVTSTITATMIALNAPFVAATASVGMYSVGIASVTSATGLATTATTLLKGALSVLTGPVGLVALAIGGLVAAFTLFGSKTDENKVKLSEHDQQLDKNKDGVLQYTEVIDGATDAILAMSDAELGLFRAEETQRKKLDELKRITDEYRISIEQAREMIKSNTNTIGLSDEQWRRLKQTVLESDNANARVNASQRRLKETQDQAQSMANKLKEQYDGVVRKMEEMSRSGNKTQADFNKLRSEAEQLSNKIRETGRSVGEMKNYQSIAYESGKCIMTGVKDGIQSQVPSVRRAGNDFGQGFVNGMWDKNGAIWNTAVRMGQTATQGIKKGTDSHSPSKAAKKVGGFFGVGFVDGMLNEINAVMSTAKMLGEAATKNLNPMPAFELALPSASSMLSSLNTDLKHGLDLSDIEQRPINITNRLKVELDGRELETVVTELQKERAQMQNRDLLSL